MEVFVTGATGVVGSRAVPALVAAGHGVTAVSRRAETDDRLTAAGARPVRLDLFAADAVRAAVDGHDAVVNLATNIPPLSKAARRSAWAVNDRLRREASRHLVDAALATGARCVVQESVCFAYVDSGDDWVTEATPLQHARVTEATGDAEREAARFAEAGGGTAVVLRFAAFYAPGAAHSQAFNDLARRRISPFPGPVRSYASSIHADDAGAAVAAALGAPGGTYNVGDDEPLRRRDADAVVAAALGVRPLRRVPDAVVRAAPADVKVLIRSQRVSNAAFREATGWAPRYPSLREGWPTTLEAASR